MLVNIAKPLPLQQLPKKLNLDVSLKPGDNHPTAHRAARWLAKFTEEEIEKIRLLLASNALEGSAEDLLCLSTLERLAKGHPIHDRYLLALCWRLKTMEEEI